MARLNASPYIGGFRRRQQVRLRTLHGMAILFTSEIDVPSVKASRQRRVFDRLRRSPRTPTCQILGAVCQVWVWIRIRRVCVFALNEWVTIT